MMSGEFYIDGTGVSIPPAVPIDRVVADGLYSAEDHAETQMLSVAIAADGFPAEMAVDAARQALAASAHEPPDIALTLYAYISNQGLHGWHSGAFVHRFAVGNSAPAIEVVQRSNGCMAALDLATAYLAARDAGAALIATADRFDDMPGGRWNYDYGLLVGDGATACVVSREGGFARILSLVSHADSTFEEVHRGDFAYIPMQDIGATPSFRRRKQQYFQSHGLAETVARFSSGISTVVTRALDDAGVRRTEVDHWVLPNVGLQELRTYYLDALKIPVDATLWNWGRTVGHLGAGDQIAGLHRLRQEGRALPGRTLVLLGVGVGFNFTCAVLRIEDE
ncbi:ketoacyl-ACP synthase III family protein [Actinoallomurus sp. CA-150999]|uniref:ketoacyl-ACP synthase III family protein n=1 Tax=Actinoallomurus sp. CA-150999 TaxID=3239887 RepID=UPI003D89C4F3